MSCEYPSYLRLFESGELALRARRAVESLADCTGCARECHADRLQGNDPKSFCHLGRRASVSSFFPHHGEEACLRGSRGSGTVFFSHCNLRCVFCQNFDISWHEEGRPVEPDELAGMMLDLQNHGCHNINLVTPSHVVPQILEALCVAVEGGLRLPLVYNTGAYDSLQTLRLLDSVVDIYMPDFKFWDPRVSKELASAEDYGRVACRAIDEMHRQVGDLVLGEGGLARRGLLVRHLVMPDSRDDIRRIMRFLARQISDDTYVNIMPQYHPEGHARRHPAINRSATPMELVDAVTIAGDEGLWRFNRR